MVKRAPGKSQKYIRTLIKRLERNKSYYNPTVFEFVISKLRENKPSTILMFLREG